MHQFNESHPAFSGFSKYYAQEIFPQLSAWERKRSNKKFFAAFGMVFSAIWCGVILYWALRNVSELVAITAAIALMISNPWVVYRFFFKDFKADVKDFLVGKVCSFTGLQYAREAGLRPPINLFASYRFFPRSYRFRRFEDHIKGAFRGINFEVVEVHGEKGRSDCPVDHTTTIFKFDLPVVSEGKLVVLRKGDRKPDRQLNMKRVGFAAPPFSHFFEVYGDDQVISRFLLHPVFLERILYAERVVDGINTRFAFEGRTLWVCVETTNRFEQGSMWTSFINPKRTQFLIWEFASVLNVVDGLVDLLPKPGRVSGAKRTGI